MTIFPLAAALATATIVAPVAALKPGQATQARAVPHADLNLSDPRDVARLDHRIRSAARDLCGTESTVDMLSRVKTRRCVDDAIARAGIARSRLVGRTGAAVVAGR